MRIKQKDTSLTETVYRRLHADIMTCRIAPGSQLKTAELARQHGVGLAAVREALSRLSSEQLVDAEPQRGFRAAAMSADRLQDLTAARIEIETLCLRQSVGQFDMLADMHLEKAMEHLLQTATARPDGAHVITPDWTRAHAAFHEALVAGCRNKVLRGIRQQLFVQSERYRSLAMSLRKTVQDIDRDHRPLLDAVRRRDLEGACHSIAQHILATTRILLATAADGTSAIPRE